ncbi:MAG: hypothetical protein ACYC3L_15185 [Gemmatimonadaceae bacterium]
MIRPLAILACVVLPLAVEAQLPAAGFGLWTTTSGKQGEAPAHGVRLHGALGLSFARFDADIEAALSQANFRRTFAAGLSRVNENSIEVAPLVHLRRGSVAWWPYAGPIFSVGIGCGTEGDNDPNGRVPCGTGSQGSVRLGLAAGVTVARPLGTLAFTTDLRAQANTIASTRGSGPVLLIAIGLRAR